MSSDTESITAFAPTSSEESNKARKRAAAQEAAQAQQELNVLQKKLKETEQDVQRAELLLRQQNEQLKMFEINDGILTTQLQTLLDAAVKPCVEIDEGGPKLTRECGQVRIALVKEIAETYHLCCAASAMRRNSLKEHKPPVMNLQR